MSVHDKKPYISYDKTKQLAQNLEASLQEVRNLERIKEAEVNAHKATIAMFEQHKRDGQKQLMAAVIFGFIVGFMAKGLA
jgi:hypothetical protein